MKIRFEIGDVVLVRLPDGFERAVSVVDFIPDAIGFEGLSRFRGDFWPTDNAVKHRRTFYSDDVVKVLRTARVADCLTLEAHVG